MITNIIVYCNISHTNSMSCVDYVGYFSGTSRIELKQAQSALNCAYSALHSTVCVSQFSHNYRTYSNISHVLVNIYMYVYTLYIYTSNCQAPNE